MAPGCFSSARRLPIIEGADSDVNANSVVSRLDYGNGSVLFAADAEELAERWLLGSGANLRATVLKVGHHGSRHSSTLGFLKAVMPLAAVISTEAGDAKHAKYVTDQNPKID